MTPCEEKGYKVGDEFEVFGATHVDDGSIVRLAEDDGSEYPFFTVKSGRSGYDVPSIHIKRLKKAGKQGDSDTITRTNGEPLATEAITLQPGDHVSTKDMTEDQYHAVARAFMGAGAVDMGAAGFKRAGGQAELLGWDDRDNELWHAYFRVCGFTGRHLTIDQALNATNAAPQETTMTETKLDVVADPITTLLAARKARDEAEQAYQQALAEAREYLGEGFALTEVGSDAGLGVCC